MADAQFISSGLLLVHKYKSSRSEQLPQSVRLGSGPCTVVPAQQLLWSRVEWSGV